MQPVCRAGRVGEHTESTQGKYGPCTQGDQQACICAAAVHAVLLQHLVMRAEDV